MVLSPRPGPKPCHAQICTYVTEQSPAPDQQFPLMGSWSSGPSAICSRAATAVPSQDRRRVVYLHPHHFEASSPAARPPRPDTAISCKWDRRCSCSTTGTSSDASIGDAKNVSARKVAQATDEGAHREDPNDRKSLLEALTDPSSRPTRRRCRRHHRPDRKDVPTTNTAADESRPTLPRWVRLCRCACAASSVTATKRHRSPSARLRP